MIHSAQFLRFSHILMINRVGDKMARSTNYYNAFKELPYFNVDIVLCIVRINLEKLA